MQSNFWTKIKAILSNVNLKTYIYALLTIGVLVAILINVTSPGKYGNVKKDGKYYLNIEQIASDYGLDLSSDLNKSVDYVNDSDYSLTDDLSRSLILTNMYLTENGLTDPTTKGKVLANVILEYKDQAIGKIYTESDINIVREENKNSVQAYFNDINNAVKDYSNKINNLKLEDISKQYPDREDINETDLVAIKGIITGNVLKIVEINDSFINSLLSIPATKNGSEYQIQLINLMSKQNAYLKSLLQIEIDPMKYIMVEGGNFDTTFKTNLSTINLAFSRYFDSFNVSTN